MKWANSQPKIRARRIYLAFVVLATCLLSGGYATIPAFHWHSPKPAHAEGATTSTGTWLNKGENCTWQPSYSCTVIVQADPVSSSNPVALVKVLAFWNETWYTLCKMPAPDSGTTDHYSCKITDWHTIDNFSYPPNGPIRFRYDIIDSQGGTFFSTDDTFTITFGGNSITPTPTVPANYAPCTGQWYDGGFTGEVYTKGNPQVITARVWPAAPGNPAIVQVEFLSQWPDGTKHDLAFVTTPRSGTTDQYTIYTDMRGIDGKYPPEGNIQVAFLCTDANGKSSSFLDGGFHQGVFQSSSPGNPQPQANGSLNICKDANYATCKNYKVGDYPTLATDGYANDVSSVQLGAGCTLAVYTGTNFTGNTGVLNSSTSNLAQFGVSAGSPNGWDNLIQSMRVQSCTGDPPPIDPPATPTPNPGNGGGSPGGMWVSGNNLTFVKGKIYTVVVRGYPANPGDAPVSYVNVTGYWNGGWHILCSIPNNDPSLGDYYYCTTNFLVGGSYPMPYRILCNGVK